MSSIPLSTHIDRAWFSIWSKDDIKKISVKKVTEPKSFEKAGAKHQDGLYSSDLGAVKRFEVCTTCGLTDIGCPGHYGHLELSVPVYHPMLVQTLYQILNKCCLQCFHFRLSQASLKLFLAQLEALNCGFDHLIEELDEIATDMCRDSKAGKDDLYLAAALGERLVARIREEKEKNPDFDCQKRPQQRNIVESLSKLYRNFINGTIVKASVSCQRCHEKKQTMSLHQSSVLVLGINSSKPLTDDLSVTVTRKSKSKRKNKIVATDDMYYIKTNEKKFITPIGARHFLRKLWKNEKRTMQRIFHFLNIPTPKDIDENNDQEDDDEDDPKRRLKKEREFQPVDLFFIDTILVPPSKFRPPMSQRGYSFEGPRTAALSGVMKQSVVVQDLIDQMINESDEVEAEMLLPKIQTQWKNLQVTVNCLWDNELDKYGKIKYPGLKQLIDKKEGLFRKNMMGKRVNFAARSVISPDPNILVDQIGVPLVFAKKLTYPEPVTPWNLRQLKQAVLNGPNKYPGAVSVVYDDDFTVSLNKEGVRQNAADRLRYDPRFNRKRNTHKGTIVHRHLLTGDVLLFNRQPTLHKPSIMAFRARVLPYEKGFRLHYANCKSFNADFDGDEMNAHVPQSELARSEAYNIASVNYQYLVPKDGSPLGGLIQDHVVAVCILTRRDHFFEKDKYNQLVYCGLSFLDKPIKIEPPTIIRPKQLWTGKQVITTIIKNCIPQGRPPLSLNIKSKIGPKILHVKPEYENLSDCNVIIRNGELLVGFMDKSNVGATQYGLVHTCYELYGGETSSNIMSAFSRLSTWFLQLYEGFTLGIGDIIVEDDADYDRQQMIIKSRTLGDESAKEALGISGEVTQEKLEEGLRESHTDRNPLPMKKLDAAMKSRTDGIASDISSRCLPEGLIRRFPDNNLQMMIQSGAKGGTVNALQISCLLGQIELEGRRVPLSMSGRSLPSFKPYDTSPKAGGFVTGRFLTGIQPQEFFFHCMAGREGLIDTAVKTSRSGYLQRCLIKHLEGLTVQYDQTVRDSCGSIIQFLYGEDGLDITKCQMLKEKAYPLLVDNHKIIAPSEDEMAKLNKIREGYEEEVIARTNDIQEWLEKNGDNRVQRIRGSGFLDFLASQLSQVKEGLISESTEIRVKIEPKEEPTDDPVEEMLVSEPNVQVKEESSEYLRTDSPEIVYTKPAQNRYRIGSHHHDQIFDAWYALSFKEKKKWNKFWEICPDPLISIMNPASHCGVVPEKLDEKIDEFVKKNPQLIVDSASLLSESETDQTRLDSYMAYDENPELSKSILTHWNQSIGGRLNEPKLTKHEFYNLCYNLYIKMLAQPGEAVGLLAAQSIGEPSTQMTLNTFHFAGRGEMNVTLGIPRLREILMTASAKIGTPSMDLPLLAVMRDEFGNELDAEAVEEQAKRVKLALNAVRLSDVLEYVDITEQICNEPVKMYAAQGKQKDKKKPMSRKNESVKSVKYDITFALLPSKYYKHEFKSNSSKAMKFIEEVFISHLSDVIVKRQKRLLLAEALFSVTVRKRENASRKQATGANENQEDAEEHDLDDYNAKVKAKEKAKEDESSSDEDDDGEGDNTASRIRNRRNPDLDYEEPEEDDLEVGDVEAQAVQVEEADQEILLDADEVREPEDNAQMKATRSSKAKRQKGGDDEDGGGGDEEEGDEDETTRRLNEQITREQEQDSRPAGQNFELAGFDDVTNNNTRSGFVTPNPETAADEDDQQADNDESLQPARKRKKIDLSLMAEAVAAAAANPDAKGHSKSSRRRQALDKATIEQRIDHVKSIYLVKDYQFDVKRERWCKVSISFNLSATHLDMAALIEAEARRTYVHRVGNIERALIVKDVNARSRGVKCDKMIKTEGVSLLSLVRFNHILDLNSIYSNDIHAIANTYGIEAASQAIRKEMANVFAVYGIEVDPRHLSLIADYMTHNGSIRGMNRMSMECSASPFQQMSFESTLRYLKGAAILGLYDDIKSPSASLVFGRPTRGGTGQFTLLADPAQVERRQHQQELKRRREADQTAEGLPKWEIAFEKRQPNERWSAQDQQPLEDIQKDNMPWGYSSADADPWSLEEPKQEKRSDSPV